MRIYQNIFFVLLFFFSTVSIGQILFNELCQFNQEKCNWNGIEKIKKNNSILVTINQDNEFGLNRKIEFPESCLGKNLQLIVNAKIKNINPACMVDFCVQILKNDSSEFWHTSSCKYIPDNWMDLNDTILIPRNLTLEKKYFSFFIWNHKLPNQIIIDHIEITILEKKFPSFMRDISISSNFDLESKKILLSNQFASICIDNQNQIAIFDSNDFPITSPINLFLTAFKNKTETIELKSFFKKIIPLNEHSISIIINNKYYTGKLEISLENKNEIKFHAYTCAKRDILIKRLSILFMLNPKPKYIYRNDLQIDSSYFEGEYWIKNQGFSLKLDSGYLHSYYNTNISSMQYSTNNNICVFNLDFHCDHPWLNFPQIKNKRDIKTDRSYFEWKKDKTISGEFSFFFTKNNIELPQISKQQDGFLATMIFTEHADFSDLKLQKAINFGSSELNENEMPIGGFVKWNIPVTKSIFYNNPEMEMNYEFNNQFSSEELSCHNTEFKNLLKFLSSKNHEICLHSPDPKTSTRRNIKKAIRFMRKEFNAKTWIDHGYNNGENDNREDIVCDGFNTKSKFYIGKVAHNNQLRYFWNCFNEDSAAYNNFDFNYPKTPYPGFSSALPYQEFSNRSDLEGNPVLWMTNQTTFFQDPFDWNFYFSKKMFLTAIQFHDVIINHFYPARVDSNSIYWNKINGTYCINEYFNNALKLLSELRNECLLEIKTIKDYLEYQQKINRIKYIISDDGIEIRNLSNEEISGLTIKVNQKKIKEITAKKNHHLPNSNDRREIWSFTISGGSKRLLPIIIQ